MLKLIIVAIFILFVWLVGFPSMVFFGVIGGMPFTVCGPGVGSSYYNARVESISEIYGVDFSGNADIVDYKCSGFQEFHLRFDLLVDKNDADKIVKELNFIAESEINDTGYLSEFLDKSKLRIKGLDVNPEYSYILSYENLGDNPSELNKKYENTGLDRFNMVYSRVNQLEDRPNKYLVRFYGHDI